MKRGMCPEDIYRLRVVSHAAISPDGICTAWTETRLDKDSQQYVGEIRLSGCRTDAEFPKQDCRLPAFSPGGTELAFLSGSGRMQLYTLNLLTGKVERRTNMRFGIKEFAWSPDGSAIYFTAETDRGIPEDQMLQEITDEEICAQQAEAKEHPRIIRDIVHKWDGQGYLTGRKDQLWSVGLISGEIRRITDLDANCGGIAFSPSGRFVVFTSDPTEDYDFRPQDINLWIFDTVSGKMKKLIDEAIFVSFPAFMSETEILFAGHESEYGWGTIPRLYLYDLKKESCTCISRNVDLSICNTAIGDFQQGSWNFSVDLQSRTAWFTATRKGATELFCTDIHGNITPALTGKFVIQSAAFTKDFREAVCVISDPSSPGRVERISLPEGRRTVIADPNGSFLSQIELSVPEHIQIRSFDDLMIDGWVMKPIGFRQGEKYPAIIEIHGGPQMAYSWNFMHEFQTLTAAGYVVGYFNPRGSSSYGQRFKSLIRREYGGVGSGDFMDIMAGTDYVESLPYVDASRMGVTGGSYGGFMTNWAVGHTDRFRAAVTQRSISNWASFVGSSDYGFCDAELAHQCSYFEDGFELERISPVSYVKNIHTPLLILHSEYDYRCPLEQAEQLFTLLKLLRRTVEMRIFPGQSHGLSRSGRPSLRIERLKSILEWFRKYMPEENK